jgi:hypothetical protein
MNRIFCPECDTELNSLYAFEREGSGWKARTHPLWHCPGCGSYLTPAARFTGRETRILTRKQYGFDGSVHRGPDITPSNGDREAGKPALRPVGRGSRR